MLTKYFKILIFFFYSTSEEAQDKIEQHTFGYLTSEREEQNRKIKEKNHVYFWLYSRRILL